MSWLLVQRCLLPGFLRHSTRLLPAPTLLCASVELCAVVSPQAWLHDRDLPSTPIQHYAATSEGMPWSLPGLYEPFNTRFQWPLHESVLPLPAAPAHMLKCPCNMRILGFTVLSCRAAMPAVLCFAAGGGWFDRAQAQAHQVVYHATGPASTAPSFAHMSTSKNLKRKHGVCQEDSALHSRCSACSCLLFRRCQRAAGTPHALGAATNATAATDHQREV